MIPSSGKPALCLQFFSTGGLLYIIGGRTNVVNDKFDSESVSVERYDPFTNEWQSMAKLNTPRHRLGVATIEGVIYAVGGCDGMVNLSTMECYDIDKDVWTVMPPMNTARMGKACSGCPHDRKTWTFFILDWKNWGKKYTFSPYRLEKEKMAQWFKLCFC